MNQPAPVFKDDVGINQEIVFSEALTPDQILDLLPTGVYTCDRAGKVIAYNKKALQIWGHAPVADGSPGNFCGPLRLLQKDGNYQNTEEGPFFAALTDGISRTHLKLYAEREDRSRLELNTDIEPVRDKTGKVEGLIICIQESARNEQSASEAVSAKGAPRFNKTNTQLKESEERYHKMIEEIEDYAILLLDKNGIIQNWNKGAEKIKGYKESEIVGKSFKFFYLQEDRERRLPEQLLEEARTAGKANHEGWRLRKDGTRFWGSVVITALHDEKGAVTSFSKVTRDLTERKKAEDKMKEYSSRLEFQNKELEQFAYAASHDMKAPLRKIHFYNTTIAENAENILDPDSREYLGRSINAVNHLNELIEDLLSYSKATSNIEALEKVDLNELIKGIALFHREEFALNQVTIQAESLPEINVVHFQFQQLLDNLINNSVKYKHPDRGVVIKIVAEQVYGRDFVDSLAEANVLFHKISIIDNGIGFDAKYSDKIFEIFQRLNNVPGQKGSGIGLAICKKIAQNHNGYIKATGKSGEGARFDIYIPVSQ